MIHVRQASPLDARQMAELLNEIVAECGTAARTSPVTPEEMQAEMRLYSGLTAWSLAEDDAATVLGFQHIGPHPDLPSDAADIATFVRLGQTGLGIGSKLFEATKRRARRIGYAWINATIRADNDSGLTYYQSKGFEDYRRLHDTVLADGATVDRVCKRYDLTR